MRQPSRIPWFKTLRIAVLLGILVMVAATTVYDRYRSTRWREPLFVGVYPIAADDSPATRRYLDGVAAGTFSAIEPFFEREAARHRLRLAQPFRLRLRPELAERPPPQPAAGGVLATMWWSLKLRYWAWHVAGHAHDPEDVRMFVLYCDPELTPTVPHSLGLTQGLIGVVYAFADPAMNDANGVVIAHELLHTVGATDKYDLRDDAPRFPEGYGDPLQEPRYPQRFAELMAGRRMLSSSRWVQPRSLDEVVIGAATAAEIRWPQHAE